MNDPLTELQRLLLRRLQNTKGKKLPAAQFTPYVNDQKRMGFDLAQIQAARDELVQRRWVLEKTIRSGKSYELTPAGAEVLRTPPTPPDGYDETLLPFHKSYLLLRLFRSTEPKVSLADLCASLDTKILKRYLGFGQLQSDERVVFNRPLVAWVLDNLATAGAVERSEFRGSPSYRLLEGGKELLLASEQYPTIKFTLTGEEFTNLLTAARLAGRTVVENEPVEQNEMPIPSSPSAQLTAEQVLAEFERLKQEEHAQHGMVPIHELRKVIGERFGPVAATHDTLDPILKDLRRQRKIRLVAIGNAGDATAQQLADSIPGENETYFAIESAHEHASIR